MTKREVTSLIARQFDPLQFLAPFTIRGKILLQEIWASGVDWDDPLPSNLRKKWTDWSREITDIPNFSVPRCLKNEKEVLESKIHIFVDASRAAYAACGYLVNRYKDASASSNLIMAKTKVAPLKAKSIPRLELDGALLGVKLAQKICTALSVDISTVVFWCDSLVTLHWIHSPSRDFKEYVANRVGAIQEATNPTQWRHVPGTLNVADQPTRGVRAKELCENMMWKHGPEFLLQGEEKWPERRVELDSDKEVTNEQRKQWFALMACNIMDVISPQRFSSWLRLCRVTGWILRFIRNCQMRTKTKGPLSLKEVQNAGNLWVKQAQLAHFSSEVNRLHDGKPILQKSKIVALNPILDKNGILRVDGRLKKAKFLPRATREPIILPRHDHVTTLIVKEVHEKLKHTGGVALNMAKLAEKYWVIKARETVKEWSNRCNFCKRKRAKTTTQIMAPLPLARLGESMRAFTTTAVDYGGPFLTKQGRGKTRTKRYLCLFTCLATRAVHLEMAWALDTNSFLEAFTRMTNRRGVPATVYSDQGTNFQGANNELKDLLAQFDQEKITNTMTTKGVKWVFNPPNAPHFGGAHEALIKSSKKAMKATLENADITDEELLTAIAGAEDLLNSRPLTYQGDDPSDDLPLTPNHFLYGQASGQLAPEAIDGTDFNPRKRWRYVQSIIHHFWKRWQKEYLPRLNARAKWFQDRGDVRVDEVVLCAEQNMPRGQWKLGRITKIFPGDDGHVRVVEVKTGGTTYTRPITRICRLEFE